MVQITVIGSSRAPNAEVEALAEQVGEEIAKANAILVCGGRGGIMAAACKGAKRENGTTVGILPFGRDDPELNPDLDILIPTGIGFARNMVVVNCGDAIISVNGALGTLTEITFALEMNKPIIFLDGSGGITDHFKEMEKLPEIQEKIARFSAQIFRAKTPKEAVELALGTVGS